MPFSRAHSFIYAMKTEKRVDRAGRKLIIQWLFPVKLQSARALCDLRSNVCKQGTRDAAFA